jgi:hypothetical protein
MTAGTPKAWWRCGTGSRRRPPFRACGQLTAELKMPYEAIRANLAVGLIFFAYTTSNDVKQSPRPQISAEAPKRTIYQATMGGRKMRQGLRDLGVWSKQDQANSTSATDAITLRVGSPSPRRNRCRGRPRRETNLNPHGRDHFTNFAEYERLYGGETGPTASFAPIYGYSRGRCCALASRTLSTYLIPFRWPTIASQRVRPIPASLSDGEWAAGG